MHICVKICGITAAPVVDAAVAAGVDRLGFVLARSPRRVSPMLAAELAARTPDSVETVAVLRKPTPDELRSAVMQAGVDLVQTELNDATTEAIRNGTLEAARLLPVLHDSEDVVRRAIDLKDVHLEGPGRGGRGVVPDWNRAARLARTARMTLAGGLTPENVAEAIRIVRPMAVDVSSGVESVTGVKDTGLIEAFVQAVRSVEMEIAES